MKISSCFNRLYHAILNEARRLPVMVVDMYGEDFKLRPSGISLDSFKQLCKMLNTSYPKENKKPLSTTKISSKDLTLHVEWLINTVYANGGEVASSTCTSVVLKSVCLYVLWVFVTSSTCTSVVLKCQIRCQQ